jgi:hypothetical protein
MDQVLLIHEEPLKGIRELPSPLLHEGHRGMRCDPRNLHAPRGQFHNKEDVVRHEAVPRRHLYGEEVGRGEDHPVYLEALRPAHVTLVALGGRLQVLTAQDVPYRNCVNGVSQVCEGSLDASIPPGGMLLGHADDQLFDLHRDARASKLTTVFPAIKLLGKQSFVPPQERIGRHEGSDFCEALAAEGVSERREVTAVCVCRVQPAAIEVGFEGAVFRKEIRGDLLLVTVEPSSA